jgi:undecaprenyl phosphate N,N'-diacetylbacillosamine 1-phosphate transferase
LRLFIGVLNKMKKLVKVLSVFSLAALILGFVVSLVEKTVFLKRYDRTCIHKPYGVYEKYFKRPMDFALSLMSIILFFPVLLVTGILVRLKLGSPIIFKQLRPGKNERIFEMYKFRSMTDERDMEGKLLPDEIRLTAFGRKLRDTSLDELPELFNILKGDMSIVGPRPQLVRDMVFMTTEQRKRHYVKQGLTGLAQVNGRNGISWEDKLDFDIQYIRKITLWGDFIILLRTVKNVFRREGIHTDGMATAEDYGDYLLRKGRINEKEYAVGQLEAQKIIEQGSSS